MRMLRVSLAAGLVWAVATGASAGTLSVGDPAPPLTVAKYVKGEKIDRLEPGQIYVVEFWATWCGPCRASIPHLTELQKKYKEKGVKFVGVSVWEQDQGKVEPFVKQMGDKMDYSVAMDDVPKDAERGKGKMAIAWMEASESNGIPTAFIVKDQKVAWIGHPMQMDEPLAKVVSGDFDISSAAARFREEKALEGKRMTVYRSLGRFMQSKDYKGAVEVIDKAIADDSAMEKVLGTVKFNLLLQSAPSQAAEYGRKLVDGCCKDDANALNAVAWAMVDPDSKIEPAGRDVKLALKAATRANELTKGENYAILDTLAKATFDSGDAARAVEFQEKAVKLSKDADPGMRERLEQYRKALKEKGDSK